MVLILEQFIVNIDEPSRGGVKYKKWCLYVNDKK